MTIFRRSVSSQGKRDLQDFAWVGVILVLLVTVVIRLRFLHVPLERDEGEFAYMGQLIREGVPPYSLAYNMKFPGIYYLYALAMSLFGESVVGIHLGLWLVNAVASILVYRLGKRLLDVTAGIVACAVFGLMTVSPSLQGTSAHATQFLLPFVLGAVLVMLDERPRLRMGRLVASGALFGAAVTVKQHAALFALFGLAAVAFGWVRSPATGWKLRIQETMAMAAGMALTLVLTGLAIAWSGTFPKFWFWTITYARQYVMILSPGEAVARFLVRAPSAMYGWSWVLVLAAGGMVFLLKDARLKPIRWFTLSFFLFSFLSVCPGFYFRNHYFITLIPSLALLAGCAASCLAASMETRWSFRYGMHLLFGMALILPLLVFRGAFFEDSDLAWSRMIYPFGCFPEMMAIGAGLKSQMGAKDEIAVLGSEPELYFYTHHRSPTGYLYTYPLMERQPLERKMQEQMIRQIEANPPRFVVMVNNNDSWLAGPYSDPFIFGWINGFLAGRYRVQGTVESYPGLPAFEIHWGKDAAAHQMRAPLQTIVLERKQE